MWQGTWSACVFLYSSCPRGEITDVALADEWRRGSSGRSRRMAKADALAMKSTGLILGSALPCPHLLLLPPLRAAPGRTWGSGKHKVKYSRIVESERDSLTQDRAERKLRKGWKNSTETRNDYCKAYSYWKANYLRIKCLKLSREVCELKKGSLSFLPAYENYSPAGFSFTLKEAPISILCLSK